MTRQEKLVKIEQLKQEIYEASARGDYSDEVVAKINIVTKLILEII